MTLPLIISPGDPGHIGHHEEIHELLGRLDGQTNFLTTGIYRALLAARPAAGVGNTSLIFEATDTGDLHYSNGTYWAELMTADSAGNFNSDTDVFLGSGRPWADPMAEQHGAVGNGVADDLGAWESARDVLDTLGGGILRPSKGTYLFSARLDFIETDNITVAGPGGRAVQITLQAAVDDGIFLVRRTNRFEARGIYFYGSNTSVSNGVSGSAIYIDDTGGATNYAGFRVRDCEFENFRGAGWVRVEEATGNQLSNIWIEHNRFTGGSDRDPANGGVSAAMVRISHSTAGSITQFWVRANIFEATAVKMGIEVIEQGAGTISKGWITDNIVNETGQTNSATVENAYGITVYGPGCSEVRVTGNQISNPFTVGIYMLGSIRCVVAGNYIEGQDETDDVTLSRGAIVMAESIANVVANNIVRTSQWGIVVQPGSAALPAATITGNMVSACPVGIMIRPHASTEGIGIDIVGNTVLGATTVGIGTMRGSGQTAAETLHQVNISSNVVESTTLGIGHGGSSFMEKVTISNNVVTTTGARGIQLIAGAAGDINALTLTGNTVTGGTSFGYQLQNVTASMISGNISDGAGTAATAATGAWSLGGAQAGLWNNPIFNLAAGASRCVTTGAEDLGLETPTWAATPGTVVHNWSPADGGSLGWVRTTTPAWKTMPAIAA